MLYIQVEFLFCFNGSVKGFAYSPIVNNMRICFLVYSVIVYSLWARIEMWLSS